MNHIINFSSLKILKCLCCCAVPGMFMFNYLLSNLIYAFVLQCFQCDSIAFFNLFVLLYLGSTMSAPSPLLY